MADPDYLIECSWEVCNKVGGIYTVVSSKADKVLDKFRGNYILVGPYFADKVQGVFSKNAINHKDKHFYFSTEDGFN